MLQEKFRNLLAYCRESRHLVLLIVAIGLLLDNMLLTVVVPIIPTFLYELNHRSLETTTPASAAIDNIHNDLIKSNFSTNVNTFLASASNVTFADVKRRQKMDYFLLQNWPNYGMNQNKTLPQTRRRLLSYHTVRKGQEWSPPTPMDEDEQRHKDLVSETSAVGLMFASKPVVQAITNLFVGPLTNRIGYSWPLFVGLILLFVSTMFFAIARSYSLLFVARSMQGVGSAFTSVAGMGMLAARYPDDRERGNCMAIALGGLALGVLIGPPFGGLMYQFVAQSSPFVTLAMLALLDGCLQLFVLQPEVVREQQKGAPLGTLIRDPYILLAAGAITFANAGIAMLEPSLPLWMMDTMNATNWEQGAAFLPASISYLVGTNIFGPLGHRIGRWLASLLGLVMIGLALIIIPMATGLSGLIIPNGMIGFAIGMVDSSMMPMLGYLVDIRHSSIYGSVYAIGDVALCIGYIIGPTFSGTLVTWFGFGGLCTITSLVCFAFAPCMFALRNPPAADRTHMVDGDSSRLNCSSIKYGAYINRQDSTSDDEDAERFNRSPLLDASKP